jgi:hypothetical protein
LAAVVEEMVALVLLVVQAAVVVLEVSEEALEPQGKVMLEV